MKKVLIINSFLILTFIIIAFNPLSCKLMTIYYAGKYNLNKQIFYNQIKSESFFRAFVVSHKGAIGLGQVTFPTAKYMNNETKKWQLFLPWYNLNLSGKYMVYLLRRYNGNYSVALAAYNWGETNVDRLLARNQVSVNSSIDYRHLFVNINETYIFIEKILK